MASIRYPESIAKLTKASSTTATLAASIINIGGQQYKTTSALTLTTSVIGAGGMDAAAVAGKLYYVYAVLSNGAPALIASTNSTLPSGFALARLIGNLTTDASANIERTLFYGQLDDEIATAPKLQNAIINGNFDFWQRTTSLNLNSVNSTSGYSADRFQSSIYGAGTQTINITASRTTSVPTQSQSGTLSQYAMQVVNSAAATLTGSMFAVPFMYQMEGQDYQRFHNKVVTFGFWFLSSVPGTYSFALGNGGGTRNLVTTFTVNSASTWEFKSITVALDNAGTWAADNTSGLRIWIAALAPVGGNGTSTLNTWGASNPFAYSGATQWIGTLGATLGLAQFSMTDGPVGYSSNGFQRAGKTIQQELALCQRYYEKSYDLATTPGTATSVGAVEWFASTTINNADVFDVKFKVSKRTTGAAAVMWSPVTTGLPGNFTNLSTSTNYTGSFTNVCEQSMLAVWGPNASVTAGQLGRFQWTVDVEL